MKERVLKLCRRLDKFTLDEISTIAEDIDESELLTHIVKAIINK